MQGRHFLDEVEEYLNKRGGPVEKRGKLDCVAFLAYAIGVGLDEYQQFLQVLRDVPADKQSRITVLLNQAGEITYVGITQTHIVKKEGVPAKAVEPSPEQAELEELHARYYTLQYESLRLRQRTESAEAVVAEANAQLRHTAQRASQAEAEVGSLRAQLNATEHLRVTAEQVAALTREKGGLEDALRRERDETAKANGRMDAVQGAFERFKAEQEAHTCSVPGLRLIMEAGCGCKVIVDHRDCNGSQSMTVDLNPSGRGVGLFFLRFKSWEDAVIARTVEGIDAGISRRKARRHHSMMPTHEHVEEQRRASNYLLEAQR